MDYKVLDIPKGWTDFSFGKTVSDPTASTDGQINDGSIGLAYGGWMSQAVQFSNTGRLLASEPLRSDFCTIPAQLGKRCLLVRGSQDTRSAERVIKLSP